MSSPSRTRPLPRLDWPNFGYLFADASERFTSGVAFRYRARGEREFEEWSHARARREGAALVALLRGQGLPAGDRVAIWSENRPEWCVAYLALAAAGFVVVPVDALLPEEEAGNVLAASGAAALVLSPKFAEALDRLRPSLPSLRALVLLDEAGRGERSGPGEAAAPRDGATRWRDMAASAPVDVEARMPDPALIAPESPAVLIFTSGTTGAPKAVMLSHKGILANVRAALTALPCWPEDVMLSVLPLHHTYPATCSFLSPYSVGASITICDRIIGKVIVDDVRDSGVTFMIGVPLLFEKLAQAIEQGIGAKPLPLRLILSSLLALSRAGSRAGLRGLGVFLLAPVRRQAGLGGIRLMVSGGGPLRAATADSFDALGFNLVQGYGMSENGPLISVNPPEARDNRSVGPAVLGTEVRIAAEPGSAEGAEGVGEIQVRSPSLMLGYWKDPEATAAAFTPDGWLRTGDLGRIDDRGYVFITGRIKSIIVTAGGKNIYPEEIEALFAGSRVVKEILVVGKRIEAGGAGEGGGSAEEVAAVVVPELEAIAADRGAGTTADRETLRELVKAEVERINRSLPPYKKIMDFRLRESEFEKNSSKKIKRFLYRDWESAAGVPVGTNLH